MSAYVVPGVRHLGTRHACVRRCITCALIGDGAVQSMAGPNVVDQAHMPGVGRDWWRWSTIGVGGPPTNEAMAIIGTLPEARSDIGTVARVNDSNRRIWLPPTTQEST